MLGILSLIVWALILVVTVKYVLILLRADNHGEGGTLALMALAHRAVVRGGSAVILLGIVSAALFYGDAMLTPALSVLSAVEGLKIVTPAFEPYVVPITVVILVALFAVQSRGTASVAAFFGPITLVWFIALGVAGLWHIAQNPGVLRAFDPSYGVGFLLDHGVIGLVTLGAVFLVVTGAEALYADLGHFGRGPIRFAWLFVALPALTINYFGQGALVLANPKAIENPFFLLYPDWALLPMVAARHRRDRDRQPGGHHRRLFADPAGDPARPAAAAGNPPHLGGAGRADLHAAGQLAAAGRRAAAGPAVPLVERARLGLRHRGHRHDGGDRACWPIVVIRKVWRWPAWAAALLIGPFLLIDLTFLGANLLKVHDGGWVPLALGGAHHGGDVHLAARQPHPVRQDAQERGAARNRWSARWRRSRRCACRAPRCSSPAIPISRRPR